MPRKLKVFQTSMGFFDLAIAAPSMKAALEAWGSKTNLFHQGFAQEIEDPKTVEAALAQPGVVLQRPVGTNSKFQENARLPTDFDLNEPAKHLTKTHEDKKKGRSSRAVDDQAIRKAAADYEKEERKREAERKRWKRPRSKRKHAANRRSRKRRPHWTRPGPSMKQRLPRLRSSRWRSKNAPKPRQANGRSRNIG